MFKEETKIKVFAQKAIFLRKKSDKFYSHIPYK
jgi:hypothetical protein